MPDDLYVAPLGVLIGYIAGEGALFLYRFVNGKLIARSAIAFKAERPGGRRLLVIGDSTALGTGASGPENSIPGLFARDFSDLTVENRARNGLLIEHVAGELEREKSSYDLILVQAGGNNIIYFKSLRKACRNAGNLVRAAKRVSPRVVMLSTGDVGLAPVVPFFLRAYMRRRSKIVRDALLKEAAEAGVAYVDLFTDRAHDVFSKDRRYYALDGLHPSDSGYAYWYQRIRDRMKEVYPDFS